MAPVRLYFYSICFIFCLEACHIRGEIDPGSEKPLNIVKRYLRWNSNGDIVSSEGSTHNFEVKYLQPHAKNVAVKDNEDYMAFSLYMRNGQPEAANTGIFHFIDSSIAAANRNKCGRPTMHAGAYYYFYGKCPEDEANLVASGYCYQGSNGRGLVYNSLTFNSVSMAYVDKQYYLNSDRTVNPIEENLIKICFKSWKDHGFPVNPWRCSTSNIPLASTLTHNSEKISDPSSGVCNDCECAPVKGSSAMNYLNVLRVFPWRSN